MAGWCTWNRLSERRHCLHVTDTLETSLSQGNIRLAVALHEYGGEVQKLSKAR